MEFRGRIWRKKTKVTYWRKRSMWFVNDNAAKADGGPTTTSTCAQLAVWSVHAYTAKKLLNAGRSVTHGGASLPCMLLLSACQISPYGLYPCFLLALAKQAVIVLRTRATFAEAEGSHSYRNINKCPSKLDQNLVHMIMIGSCLDLNRVSCFRSQTSNDRFAISGDN
jgi:hypothetical protein